MNLTTIYPKNPVKAKDSETAHHIWMLYINNEIAKDQKKK